MTYHSRYAYHDLSTSDAGVEYGYVDDLWTDGWPFIGPRPSLGWKYENFDSYRRTSGFVHLHAVDPERVTVGLPYWLIGLSPRLHSPHGCQRPSAASVVVLATAHYAATTSAQLPIAAPANPG